MFFVHQLQVKIGISPSSKLGPNSVLQL